MPDLPLATVRDLKAVEIGTGRPFASVLLLRKVATKTASNGNSFLSLDGVVQVDARLHVVPEDRQVDRLAETEVR